jgi:shikimate 5-dehydrogenase
MFPLWAEILGWADAQLVGVDLPIDAPPEAYRRLVSWIKQDPLSLGAIITTHKINTLNAARDLFDELSEDTRLCGEVSCVYKRHGRLIGHMVELVTCGQALDRFVDPGHWRKHGAQILCLGSGGAATALAAHFLVHRRPETGGTDGIC